MEIILDGDKIKDTKDLYIELKRCINSDAFYGNNLDALWDVLSYSDEDITLKIINEDVLSINLGEIYISLIKLFDDLKDTGKEIEINYL